MAVKTVKNSQGNASGGSASLAKALAVAPAPSKSAPPVLSPASVEPPQPFASPVRTRASSKPTSLAVGVAESKTKETKGLAISAEPVVPAVDPLPTSEPAIVPSPTPPTQSLTTINPGDQQPNKKVETIMKTAEQFVAFSQANVDAFVKSSQIWTTGLQGLSKQMAANAQLALDETVSTLKAMTSVKSVKEAIELQTSLARTAMEKAVSGTTQITETSIKLAEETLAPITERMHVAAQTFTVAA